MTLTNNIVGDIVGGFITILIGTALLPEIASRVEPLTFYYKSKEREPREPYKQTYLEYVKERLEVEKLLR